jgi:lipooligosaccharide transport system permease protein
MIRPLHLVQRNARVYRRVWRGSLFGSFVQPTLFLLAFGVGLGGVITRGGRTLPGGVSFLQFVATGLLASAAMQTAAFESSYPIHNKFVWRRNYEAITATPMRPIDLVCGELAWLTVRLAMVTTAFLLVLTAFGVPRSPLAPLAVPAAMLVGVAVAAPIMAYAATLPVSGNFNVVFRFITTPLFLFSGVFFPLGGLPDWLQRAAWISPLFHGVELVRGLVLGPFDMGISVLHTACLVGLFGTGVAAAAWTFRRRLTP